MPRLGLRPARSAPVAGALDGLVVRRQSVFDLRQSRALSILHGLEASLDFEKGGEIAASLAAIYARARHMVLAAGRDNDADAVAGAREMIGEIASAWDAIG